MIQSEHQERMDRFKKEVIELAEIEIKQEEGLTPKLAILCLNTAKEGKIYGVMIMPIPGEIIASASGKDLLAQQVIPRVIQLCEDEGKIPIMVNLTTEAWWRDVDIKEYEEKYKDKPFTDIPISGEGISFFFETQWSGEVIRYDIHREAGKESEATITYKDTQNTANGAEGRFANLFRKKIDTAN
jgi:hypothetical protein